MLHLFLLHDLSWFGFGQSLFKLTTPNCHVTACIQQLMLVVPQMYQSLTCLSRNACVFENPFAVSQMYKSLICLPLTLRSWTYLWIQQLSDSSPRWLGRPMVKSLSCLGFPFTTSVGSWRYTRSHSAREWLWKSVIQLSVNTMSVCWRLRWEPLTSLLRERLVFQITRSGASWWNTASLWHIRTIALLRSACFSRTRQTASRFCRFWTLSR